MINHIEIKASHFPSKQNSVTVREPMFADRRVAFERHPGTPDTGYTTQELLLSMCLVKVNQTEVPEQKDVLENLRGLNHKDGQFLLSTFMSLFQLSEEDLEACKKISLNFAETTGTDIGIPASDMPTARFGVAFRIPKFEDRRRVQKFFPKSESDSGYSFEELFLASCITKIGKDTIPESAKSSATAMISLLDNWPLLDLQFALNIFLTLTTIDSAEASQSADLGKSLRAAIYSPDPVPSTPTVEAPSNSSPPNSKKKEATTSSTS